MDRMDALRTFYGLLDELTRKCGALHALSASSARLNWPRRGVYFFFEPGEVRRDSGEGPRVVRVGTHALTAGTTLWNRLSQHAGQKKSGGGNHRGSIFRLLVGEAMMRRDRLTEPASWGIKSHYGAAAIALNVAATGIRESELALEKAVSKHIGGMPFLVVNVEDESGPESNRAVIERGAVALLSNYGRDRTIDPPSQNWLGRFSGRDRVRESGLWNNNYVDEKWSGTFLRALEEAICRTSRLTP